MLMGNDEIFSQHIAVLTQLTRLDLGFIPTTLLQPIQGLVSLQYLKLFIEEGGWQPVSLAWEAGTLTCLQIRSRCSADLLPRSVRTHISMTCACKFPLIYYTLFYVEELAPRRSWQAISPLSLSNWLPPGVSPRLQVK